MNFTKDELIGQYQGQIASDRKEIAALRARVAALEAALELEHEEVNRLRDLGFALRARVAKLEAALEAAQEAAQHLIRDLGGLETASVMGSELCLTGDAERETLRAQIAEFKELLIPARDMIKGFSFGKHLAADIDAALN